MSKATRLFFVLSIALVTLAFIAGCGGQDVEVNDDSSDTSGTEEAENIGTEDNPVVMALVPSADTAKLVQDGEKLAELLEKETGLVFEVQVPASYTAVVQAMGAGNVDVGWLSSLPYVLAHEQYGVEVILRTVRENTDKYWSVIIAKNDSGIESIADLEGKNFAYGDPVSTSGAIYPKHLIRSEGHDPDEFFGEVTFAGSHDRVVMLVYNGSVDAGAIFGGVHNDARQKVLETIPSIMDETKIIAKSVSIPNDTVSVRKGLPEEITEKIAEGLKNIAKSDQGRLTLSQMYGIEGFVDAEDSDYDSVRKVAKSEDIKLEAIDK